MAHVSDFDKLIPRAKKLGFIATLTAAAITAQFGWHLGKGYLEQVSLGVLLAICTFIVGYALTFAFQAYKRQMREVGHAAVALFAIGVCVEFLSHTGFTAANRDTTIAQARLQQTVTGHNIGEVDQLSKTVQRLEERLRMTPVRNAEQAQAAIDQMQADRLWDVTDGCKRTTGPKTRDFCSSYASAIADKAGATEAITMREELKTARADLAKARKATAESNVDPASAASQGLALASIFTMSDKPGEKAVFWAGIGISSLLALFAIAAGGLLNFVAYAFDGTTAHKVQAALQQAMQTPANLQGYVMQLGVNGEPIASKVHMAPT